MDKTYNRWRGFLLNLLYIAMVFTLTNLIGDVIGLEISYFGQLIIVIMISTLIKYYTKYPILIFISLIIGFFIMLLLDTYKFDVFLPIAGRWSKLFSNIIGNLQGQESIAENNINMTYYLIVLLLSTYTSIIIYRSKKNFLLILLYLPIFLSYWYSFVDRAFNLTAAFLFFFLILLGLKSYKTRNFKDKKVFQRWNRTAVVYSFLIIFLAFYLPKSNDFINFPWLQRKVYTRFPIVEDLRNYKDYNRETGSSQLFDFSTSGFSDKDSDLGGPLVQTDKKVMTVQTKEPVYLRGNIKDSYDGSRWTRLFNPVYEFEIKEDISFLLNEDTEKKFNRKDLTVTFNSYSSKTIFTPYMPRYINSNRNLVLNTGIDGIISSEKGIFQNESYYVEYLDPLPYEQLIDDEGNLIQNPLEIYKDNFHYDFDLYLQVPDNISSRTKELTSSLVEGLETDYEKAIAIQDHLRNNYTYNLDVGSPREGEEFIDYFLFEEQEGYCTSYASSMAVMLRLEGIASRYVEGYIVNEKIEEDNYQVRQKHAHTWVEAFIEPIGWISFEPTAAYEPLNQDIKDDEDTPSPDMDEDMVPDKDDLPNLPEEDIDLPDEDESPQEDSDIDKENNLKDTIRTGIFIVFTLALILRVLTRYIGYYRKEKTFKTLTNDQQIIYLYKDILDILSILGFPMLLGETHFEYADRIAYKFTDLEDYGIKDATDLFVRVKYSHFKASDDDLMSVVNYKNQLNDRLRNKLGKLNYYYRKYINIYLKKRNNIP